MRTKLPATTATAARGRPAPGAAPASRGRWRRPARGSGVRPQLEDDVRRAGHDLLGADLRVERGRVGEDVLGAQPAEQLVEEGARAGDEDVPEPAGVAAHREEHLERRTGEGIRGEPGPELGRQPVAGRGHAAAPGDRQEGALDVGEGLVGDDEHATPSGRAWRPGRARGRSTGEIGPQADDALEVGVEEAAQAGLVRRLRRPGGVVAHADHAVPEPQGVDRLGEAGGEGDDAPGAAAAAGRVEPATAARRPRRPRRAAERRRGRRRAGRASKATATPPITVRPGAGKPSASA